MVRKFFIFFLSSALFLLQACDSGTSPDVSSNPTPAELQQGVFRSGGLLYSSTVSQLFPGRVIAVRFAVESAEEEDNLSEVYGALAILDVTPQFVRFGVRFLSSDTPSGYLPWQEYTVEANMGGIDINGDGTSDVYWQSAGSNSVPRPGLTNVRTLMFAAGDPDPAAGPRMHWSFRPIDTKEPGSQNPTQPTAGLLSVLPGGTFFADGFYFEEIAPFDPQTGQVIYGAATGIVGFLAPGDLLIVNASTMNVQGEQMAARPVRRVVSVSANNAAGVSIETRPVDELALSSIFDILKKIKFNKSFKLFSGKIPKKSLTVAGQTVSLGSPGFEATVNLDVDIEGGPCWTPPFWCFKHFWIKTSLSMDGDSEIGLILDENPSNALVLGIPLSEPIWIPDTPFVINAASLAVQVQGQVQGLNMDLVEQYSPVTAWAEVNLLSKHKTSGGGSASISTKSLTFKKHDFTSVTPRVGLSTSVTLADLLGFPLTLWTAAEIQNQTDDYKVTYKEQLTISVTAEIDDIIKYQVSSFTIWEQTLSSETFPKQ
jgi:hypothetical protein